MTSPYEEVQRFKRYAAVHSAKDDYLHGVPVGNGIFQVITDNFNKEMNSKNNNLLWHCLETILTKNEECV